MSESRRHDGPSGDRARRLVQHLRLLGRALEDDRAPSEERLTAMLDPQQLRAVRASIEDGLDSPVEVVAPAEPVSGAQPDGWMVRRLSQLKGWHWSLFFTALGCGAAVAIVGLIDLVWNARVILGGLGAVAIVLFVYTHTRHLRAKEDWIAS